MTAGEAISGEVGTGLERLEAAQPGPGLESALLEQRGEAPAGVRAEIGEEIGVSMTGSLNLRRCVLKLLTGVQPEVADWAVLVWVNPRNGALTLWGGDDPAATVKASRRAIAGQAL